MTTILSRRQSTVRLFDNCLTIPADTNADTTADANADTHADKYTNTQCVSHIQIYRYNYRIEMCLTGETTSHLTDNLSQQSMNCKIYHIGEVCIVILTTLVSLHTEIDQISEKVSFADS